MTTPANAKTRTHRPAGSRPTRRAFTLVELMLAVGVIVALTVITLPAFRAIQEGNREAGGINAVSASLNTARSMAVRKGRDVGVMFLFDVQRQVCSLQLVEEHALTSDADGKSGGWTKATIFRPVRGQAPMELPEGAAVFGYGYGATRVGNANPNNPWNWYTDLGQFYEQNSSRDEFEARDPWLFPRTDVRLFSGTIEEADDDEVEHLETFLVRFSPQGTVVTSAEELASGDSSKANDGYLELDHLHTEGRGSEWKENSNIWSPRVLDAQGGLPRRVLAEAQVRAVPFLAVVDLFQLAAETGIRSPWLTLGQAHPLEGEMAGWDSDGDEEEDHLEIDRWIRDNATVLTFNRYTGNVMKEERR